MKPADGAADARALADFAVEAERGVGRVEEIVRPVIFGASALHGEVPRVRAALALGGDRALPRAETAGLKRRAAARRTRAALRAQRNHAADRLAAVERALRAVRDFEIVARAEAGAAEVNLVVGVRIVGAQAVDQEERLIRI